MASYFNYIERPANNSSFCRFCDHQYKEFFSTKGKKSHESRNNLYNKKGDKPSLKERLSTVNLVIEDDPNLSRSICDKCENKIKKLEEAEKIINNWSGVKRKIEIEDTGEVPPTKKSNVECNAKVCTVLL